MDPIDRLGFNGRLPPRVTLTPISIVPLYVWWRRGSTDEKDIRGGREVQADRTRLERNEHDGGVVRSVLGGDGTLERRDDFLSLPLCQISL